jgi:hypothetical protein
LAKKGRDKSKLRGISKNITQFFFAVYFLCFLGVGVGGTVV